MSRIFIINERGELVQLNNSITKSYTLLNEIVNDMFPKVNNEAEYVDINV
jgi:phosphatidate phosphatase PAH1